MDQSKQPGLKFDRIIVKNINFDRTEQFTGKPKLNINFKQNIQIDPNKNRMICLLTGSLEDENKNFHFEATIAGFFSSKEENPNMPIEEFAKSNALAHMFPFFRELVFNITSRAGIPPIILPPMNVNAMIKDSEKKKK